MKTLIFKEAISKTISNSNNKKTSMKNLKNRWKNYNNKSINYNSTTINYNKKKTQKKKLL